MRIELFDGLFVDLPVQVARFLRDCVYISSMIGNSLSVLSVIIQEVNSQRILFITDTKHRRCRPHVKTRLKNMVRVKLLQARHDSHGLSHLV